MKRLRTGDILCAVYGAALLTVMTVLDWFSPSGNGDNAWMSFAVTDVLLALAAVGGILVALTTAARGTPAVPLVFTVVTTVLAWLAVLVLLYRIVNEPGPDDIVGVGAGAWAGWLLTLALALSAYWALRDERTPGLDPAPEPERMPAPGRGTAAPQS
jgi:hypothetical protein